MIGPESPPLRSVSRVSSLNPPLSFPRPWHLMQLASKIGLISFEKSIVWDAGDGSCAACSWVIAARAANAAKQSSAPKGQNQTDKRINLNLIKNCDKNRKSFW